METDHILCIWRALVLCHNKEGTEEPIVIHQVLCICPAVLYSVCIFTPDVW